MFLHWNHSRNNKLTGRYIFNYNNGWHDKKTTGIIRGNNKEDARISQAYGGKNTAKGLQVLLIKK